MIRNSLRLNSVVAHKNMSTEYQTSNENPILIYYKCKNDYLHRNKRATTLNCDDTSMAVSQLGKMPVAQCASVHKTSSDNVNFNSLLSRRILIHYIFQSIELRTIHSTSNR